QRLAWPPSDRPSLGSPGYETCSAGSPARSWRRSVLEQPAAPDQHGDALVTESSSRVRLGVIGIIVAALFSALFFRLWFLQVATTESYAADKNTHTGRH